MSATLTVLALIGTAFAQDGDSLILRGEKVRLAGIDAPELHQTCQRYEERWNCGHDSAKYLAKLVAQDVTICEYTKRDRYKRPVATCTVGNVNLNEAMVKTGLAVAYHKYNPPENVIQAEKIAKSAKAGLWESDFVRPERWRKRKRRR